MGKHHLRPHRRRHQFNAAMRGDQQSPTLRLSMTQLKGSSLSPGGEVPVYVHNTVQSNSSAKTVGQVCTPGTPGMFDGTNVLVSVRVSAQSRDMRRVIGSKCIPCVRN